MFSILRTLFVSMMVTAFMVTLSMADMALLSEEELGDFVAEEGVCDFRLPDACNTDPVLAATRSQDKTDLSQAMANANADPAHAIQVGQINPVPVAGVPIPDKITVASASFAPIVLEAGLTVTKPTIPTLPPQSDAVGINTLNGTVESQNTVPTFQNTGVNFNMTGSTMPDPPSMSGGSLIIYAH